MGSLGGGRERGKFRVDLVQEFRKFVEVEGAREVFVVLFEEFVEPSEMVGCLREASLDAVGDFAPLVELELYFLGILASFPGYCAQERDDVLGQVVLDRGAVANSVHVT